MNYNIIAIFLSLLVPAINFIMKHTYVHEEKICPAHAFFAHA